MRKVKLNDEGKKVILNTEKDQPLYLAPFNPPNTGIAYTRGTDLYHHKAQSGDDYFYFKHWSMWLGEKDSLELCSREEAEDFLIHKASLDGRGALDIDELEQLECLGFNLLEEDA